MNANINEVNNLLDKYKINSEDRKYFWQIISPIFEHEEFQRRMNSYEFPHHDTISLGNHIICNAIVSYLIAKNIKNVDVDMAITMAMFHDLYECPWQNNVKEGFFANKHGYVHPIEAAINSVTWYPEYFKDLKRSKTILDAVIHHMCPYPVKVFDSKIELNNYDKFLQLSDDLKEIIVKSTYSGKIGTIAVCPINSVEGKIVSIADKVSTITGGSMSLDGWIALITGKNKKLLDGFKRARVK